MTAKLTAAEISGQPFDPPGPGSWMLDLTHFPRPVARFMTDPAAFLEPKSRGFVWTLKRYGLPVLQPEFRFVNGLAYMHLWPAPGHELAERFANAACAFEAKLWREDAREWDLEVKPAAIRAHLSLQRTDPRSLGRAALLEHLAACYSHLQRMVEQHYRYTCATFVPVGDFLVAGSELSGAAPAELLVLTRGSAPVSGGSSDGLGQLAAAIRADDGARSVLESGAPAGEVLAELRARPGAVCRATWQYWEMIRCRLLGGFEVGCPCAFEFPELVVKVIRGAVAGGGLRSGAGKETARVRGRVPARDRDRFDELLAEARLTYRLRDERATYTSIWALGLMRRAILAAGDVLAAERLVADRAHLVEARYAEIVSLLQTGEGPGAAELRAHSQFRSSFPVTRAPRHLGNAPAPAPTGLPEPAQRALRAVGMCIDLLFTEADPDRTTTKVPGLPASPGVYEGRARLITGPDEFGRLAPGDVLVTRSTSGAFTLVLPLVGAIVTDSGGLLSHPAIIAREYGIPAVVGTQDSTRLIPDGGRVRVDGTTGEVTMLR